MSSDGAAIAQALVVARIKMPGVQNDVAKMLGGVDVSGVGRNIGQRFTGVITKTLKAAGAAAGGLLAAGMATGAIKGIQRLNAIDVAEKKMTGLGFTSAQTSAAMKNALASVKGTSHGLGDAATVASQLMAANIQPGAQLESVLKSVANTASAAGVSMGDMGSIFAKVSSLGKAQNDVLQQVADRGLPIYQKLAEQFGVTTEEVFKMASEGKIGFAEFEKAMTESAGNVALNMGNTVGGSWANFLASLGRIGAGLFGGVFPHIAPILQSITQALAPLEDVAAKVGDKFGTWLTPMVEKFIGFLNNGFDVGKFFEIASSLSPLANIFKAIEPVLPALGAAFGELAKSIGGALANALPVVLPPLLQVVEALADLIADVLPPVSTLLGVLADAIADLLPTLAPLVATLAKALAPILKALAPIISTLAKALTPIIELVGIMLVPVIQVLSGVLDWVANIISGVLVVALNILIGAFNIAWGILEPIFTALGTAAQWVFETILVPAFKAGEIGFALLGGILAGIWETVIKPVWNAFAATTGWLYNTIIKPVFNLIGAVIKQVWENNILPVFNVMKGVIEGTLGPVFTWLKTSVIDPIWNGIKTTIDTVWNNGIKPVIDTLVRIIQSDPKKAFEAARDAIGDAWKGIQDLAKAPVRFVIETVINGLIDTINLIPGVDLPKVPLPAGFAHGGILPGMSRMGDGDDQLIAARRGEGIMVSEALRSTADRNAFLAVNAAGRRGVGFASMLQGFATGGLIHPMPQGRVSTGWLGYPGHYALDFAAAQGTPIRAAGDGTVIHSGWDAVPGFRGYGNVAMVQHRNGLATLYAHMLAGIVGTGAQVKQGQQIGQEGSTGNSTGPHLHYEVWRDGKPVNPADYLTGGGAVGTAGLQEEIGGLAGWAMGKLKEAFPGSDMWIDMAAGMLKNAVDTVIDVALGWIPIGGGVPALYDSGGWLPTGKSLVENRTGKPEPIFTGSQWADISSLAAGGGSGGDGTAVFHLYDSDGVLMGTMDGRIETALQPVSARALQDTLGV